MLENFREIYQRELENIDSALEWLILDSQTVRAFVYEICKNTITSQAELEVAQK